MSFHSDCIVLVKNNNRYNKKVYVFLTLHLIIVKTFHAIAVMVTNKLL